MRPIYFPQQNTILGKDQVEVAALPAFRGEIPYHPTPGRNTERVISCYRLTEKELEDICRNGVIWLQQVVAVGGPLQPQVLSVENPFDFEDGTVWDGKGRAKENWKKK